MQPRFLDSRVAAQPPDVSVQQTFTVTVEVADGQGGTATDRLPRSERPMPLSDAFGK